jgi:hypothetical protein
MLNLTQYPNTFLKLSLVLAIITLGLVACQQDSEEFIPNDESFSASTLIGFVVDEDDNPVVDATVTFGNTTVKTDAYGSYLFTNARVSSDHNLVSIEKDGFFSGYKVFRADESKTIQLRSKLLSANIDYSFPASSGGTYNGSEIKLDFPSNAIVVESTGAAYSGEVNVSVVYIDPTDDLLGDIMPGDLSARNAAGNLVVLNSYGMLGVELSSSNGQKLQIKEGSAVSVETTIPQELMATAPSEIDLWSYNEETGLWDEEGKATLSGNKYVAQVSHFSFWNYDIQFESVFAKGRIVDEDGNPLSQAYVSIHLASNNRGGHGAVNLDGTFKGRIPAGENLVLRVYLGGLGCGWGNPDYEKNIGPYTSDVDLGDITVTIPSINETVVEGTLVDCNGDKITNGLVKIGSQYSLVKNGDFKVKLNTCNTGTLEFEAIDRAQIKTSGTQQLNYPEKHSLGTIAVCEQASYITIECIDLGIDTAFIDGVRTQFFQQNSKLIYGELSGTTNDSSFSFIQLRYDDSDTNKFNTGSFQLRNVLVSIDGQLSNDNEFKYFYLGVDDSGTITVNNVTSTTISGSYVLTATNEYNRTEKRSISGEFYILR